MMKKFEKLILILSIYTIIELYISTVFELNKNLLVKLSIIDFLICIIFLPSLIMPSNIASFGGKLSGYWAKFCLRIFLSTKIIVKGLENIDKIQKK